MLRKTLVLIISLFFSLSAFSQDCENYFIYQQNDSLTFTFQGFMVEPGQTLYNWDFGDGNTGSGKVITHTFDPQGGTVLEVCLYTETFDTTGNSCLDTSCQNITVGNSPGCLAFFFGAASQSNPMTWVFTDFSYGNPTSFVWVFGDGTTSNLQNPLHTFVLDGTYQVCLTVFDSVLNCEDEYCEEIIVVGNPVIEDCESDFTYSSTDLLTFDFEGFMVDSVQQTVDYNWDFGDGNFGNGQFITYTYQPTGAAFYPVCLTTTVVFDSGDTCIFESCRDVYVGNIPECQALYSWGFGSQPFSVEFTDISIGGPTTWYWDFGDQTYSSLQHPTHIFPREDIFTVCLTMTNDSTTCTSTFCTDINVNNIPPPVDCYNTIVHSLGADIYTFDFHGEAFSNDLNVSSTSTFNWNMGDGNTASGQDITHTYASAGTYVAILTTVSILNNSDTCVSFSSDSIFISNLSYCIGGYVYVDTSTNADAGQVHLLLYDAANNNLVMTETESFDNTGYYLFEDVNYGNGLTYYVQAELSQQSAHFGQYIPTYHYNATYWTNGQLATAEECPTLLDHDIMMQENTAASPGVGSINGVVYSGETKDVIQDMEVLLLDEDRVPLMYIYTDENGMFNFSSLAYGSYYIYPERVGIITEGFMVTLSEEEASVEMIIIIGDGTASLSVEEYSIISIMDDPYPNPANTQLNLSISAVKAADAALFVYNQLGQQMLIQNMNLSKGLNKIELNISSLPESVYYIRLQAHDGKPLMRTFVKVN